MNETLLKRLKELRIQKGMTQGEIAEMLDIKRSTYGEYERGKISPPIEKVEAMAKIFDVIPQYLLGWDKYENNNDISSMSGSVIKSIRLQRNMTEAEFAKDIGISVSDLRGYEGGSLPISPFLIRTLADYLNLPIETLVGAGAMYRDYRSIYVAQNPIRIKQYEKWSKELGNYLFTMEEHDKIIEYAKFIKYIREEGGHKQ